MAQIGMPGYAGATATKQRPAGHDQDLRTKQKARGRASVTAVAGAVLAAQAPPVQWPRTTGLATARLRALFEYDI
jgi:hypothetical protein